MGRNRIYVGLSAVIVIIAFFLGITLTKQPEPAWSEDVWAVAFEGTGEGRSPAELAEELRRAASEAVARSAEGPYTETIDRTRAALNELRERAGEAARLLSGVDSATNRRAIEGIQKSILEIEHLPRSYSDSILGALEQPLLDGIGSDAALGPALKELDRVLEDNNLDADIRTLAATGKAAEPSTRELLDLLSAAGARDPDVARDKLLEFAAGFEGDLEGVPQQSVSDHATAIEQLTKNDVRKSIEDATGDADLARELSREVGTWDNDIDENDLPDYAGKLRSVARQLKPEMGAEDVEKLVRTAMDELPISDEIKTVLNESEDFGRSTVELVDQLAEIGGHGIDDSKRDALIQRGEQIRDQAQMLAGKLDRADEKARREQEAAEREIYRLNRLSERLSAQRDELLEERRRLRLLRERCEDPDFRRLHEKDCRTVEQRLRAADEELRKIEERDHELARQNADQEKKKQKAEKKRAKIRALKLTLGAMLLSLALIFAVFNPTLALAIGMTGLSLLMSGGSGGDSSSTGNPAAQTGGEYQSVETTGSGGPASNPAPVGTDGTIPTGSPSPGGQHPDGSHTTANPDGTPSTQGEIVSGKPDGHWQIHDGNGKLIAEGEYRDGKREGTWQHYHPNGTVSAAGNYSDGEREGQWEFFNEQGRKIGSLTFDDGEIVGKGSSPGGRNAGEGAGGEDVGASDGSSGDGDEQLGKDQPGQDGSGGSSGPGPGGVGPLGTESDPRGKVGDEGYSPGDSGDGTAGRDGEERERGDSPTGAGDGPALAELAEDPPEFDTGELSSSGGRYRFRRDPVSGLYFVKDMELGEDVYVFRSPSRAIRHDEVTGPVGATATEAVPLGQLHACFITPYHDGGLLVGIKKRGRDTARIVLSPIEQYRDRLSSVPEGRIELSSATCDDGASIEQCCDELRAERGSAVTVDHQGHATDRDKKLEGDFPVPQLEGHDFRIQSSVNGFYYVERVETGQREYMFRLPSDVQLGFLCGIDPFSDPASLDGFRRTDGAWIEVALDRYRENAGAEFWAAPPRVTVNPREVCDARSGDGLRQCCKALEEHRRSPGTDDTSPLPAPTALTGDRLSDLEPIDDPGSIGSGTGVGDGSVGDGGTGVPVAVKGTDGFTYFIKMVESGDTLFEVSRDGKLLYRGLTDTKFKSGEARIEQLGEIDRFCRVDRKEGWPFAVGLNAERRTFLFPLVEVGERPSREPTGQILRHVESCLDLEVGP